MDLQEKRVLLTGGSVGIGKALVAGLGQRGVHDIAVMGRRPQPLEAMQL
ncbi:hypothetical protein GCM10022408_11770 [Hymenobacter fastidiosus]|uniref:SDR family NAD(P)-dependent oxidoreductase n=1 Tax=Hymenobacter fastidiosus TaxID=486264 RepID=A0ABP7RU22_9BACT